ncbi:HAD family hydrolase [Cellulomonas fimi]|uniref:HAD family hydrolase n=1 Tax=Cellulomonas fimi TaxID=1708 RepID=A0A7Y0M0D5_CELFI|nr:HAD family hydrolase [Cellulomonas fimi]NMR21109.1 HAD family hydrolase [Cellulomonas fimi]
MTEPRTSDAPRTSDENDGAAPPGAVLLDIDGTLVDSNYLHVHAWTEAFAAAGRPVDAWRIHRGIGMGSGQLLDDLLGPDAERLAGQVKDEHARRYLELAGLLRPFDGARDLVRALVDRGAAVVLATSAAPDELEKLREVLDVDEHVLVVGAGDVEEAKPEPDLVESALRKADVPPERAVFVGDSRWDAIACARADVPCVGVLTGGTSATELAEEGVVAVYDDVAHLLRELDRSPLAAAWSDG